MRAVNHFLFDDDIVDRILRSLVDFASLRSIILTCKAVHGVFQARPKSIIRAVAYNIVGPVLPQALLLARNQCSGESFTETDFVTPAVDVDTIIARDQMDQLEENEAVVMQFEDMFSLRHKDWSSAISLLSDLESLRFRQALYNFWLYQSVFSLEKEDFEAWDDFDEDGISESRKRRLGYLENYSSQELQALNSVSSFLEEIYREIMTFEGISEHSPEIALSLGPKFILDNYQSLSESMRSNNWGDPESEFFLGYVSDPTTRILEQRNEKVSPEPYLKVILDSIHGEHDKCSRCQAVFGLDLFVESNWHLLRGKISPWDVVSLFGPRLSKNQSDIPLLLDVLRKGSKFTLVDEIHQLRTDPYLTWEAQDLVCLECLKAIISHHLRLWALQRLHEAGIADRDDCWYGHNCRTQVHKASHAEKLNHFCDATRGDGE